jgi:hypothetical protein
LESEPFFSELDIIITIEEIVKAAKALKRGKATGLDRISNEMIKASVPYLSRTYAKIFNTILQKGHYPESWSKGFIVNIFKAGGTSDPGSYRGITINSCMSKLFSNILNSRLVKFFDRNNTLSSSQIGFRKGSRTSDHIFTISTLVDKHIKKNKKPLFICFIDFRKAYDSVWQEGLFLKLLKNNIRGNFYTVIKNMYRQSVACVRSNGQDSAFFQCKNAVKQGETLSPLLFNLFIVVHK